MDAAVRAFANCCKTERDRAEKALLDILEILLKPVAAGDDPIDSILKRMECHWGDSAPERRE